jgi:glucokinase
MIVAGDVGGTKARIGLFEKVGQKLELIVSERYTSREFGNLETIVKGFLDQHKNAVKSPIVAACFGLPGPVINGRVKVTNLPWEVVQADVSSALGIPKVKLVNDLVSTAAAIPTFGPQSLVSIYPGKGDVDQAGSCVVVAPGTGLGHSLIHREGAWSVLLASEGGHANFAPTNDLEIELLKYLQKKDGHVGVESVLCGPGLVNIYNFLKDSGREQEPKELATEMSSGDKAATIAKHGLDGSFDICVKALDVFCYALGAHASNIVLTWLATGGVYLGGGIPPKIVEALKKGPFLQGYLKKGKCLDRVEATPVFVIMDDFASLYGAAAIASTL